MSKINSGLRFTKFLDPLGKLFLFEVPFFCNLVLGNLHENLGYKRRILASEENASFECLKSACVALKSSNSRSHFGSLLLEVLPSSSCRYLNGPCGLLLLMVCLLHSFRS